MLLNPIMQSDHHNNNFTKTNLTRGLEVIHIFGAYKILNYSKYNLVNTLNISFVIIMYAKPLTYVCIAMDIATSTSYNSTNTGVLG